MHLLDFIPSHLIFSDFNNNFPVKGLFNYLSSIVLNKAKANHFLTPILKSSTLFNHLSKTDIFHISFPKKVKVMLKYLLENHYRLSFFFLTHPFVKPFLLSTKLHQNLDVPPEKEIFI